MNKKLLLVLLVSISSLAFGQKTESDSLKKAMMKEMSLKGLFKEKIYDFKEKKLPLFELTLLNGKKIKSEFLKGKPTVINFWFSNCHPCIDEMPLLNKIKSEFGSTVNFISITFQSNSEVNEFLKSNKFEFTHVIEAKEYIDTYGFFGYPKTLILDKNLIIKNIEKRIPNDIDNEEKNKAEFIARISTLLEELKKSN
ncbi:TlpA disulfide reductase family protein [uncultured Tenacibaculum sp.]|uniref:TlpA family protein disulfide reductase n=1 Tax=uncultured Tenacibaculum sp. TaxID=174713 RepID=UPI0026277288|nr:TlpA disulfide reductase family protein [uncultured Tenacibaculum sp.]